MANLRLLGPNLGQVAVGESLVSGSILGRQQHTGLECSQGTEIKELFWWVLFQLQRRLAVSFFRAPARQPAGR